LLTAYRFGKLTIARQRRSAGLSLVTVRVFALALRQLRYRVSTFVSIRGHHCIGHPDVTRSDVLLVGCPETMHTLNVNRGPPHCACSIMPVNLAGGGGELTSSPVATGTMCHLEGMAQVYGRALQSKQHRHDHVAPGGIILVAIVVNMLLMLLICQVQC
jgi:hypothetical protein